MGARCSHTTYLIMSRNKVKNCNHAYYRASERCGWDRKTAYKMMKLASKNGLSPDNLGKGEKADLLRFRQLKTDRRIKYYQGYVYAMLYGLPV